MDKLITDKLIKIGEDVDKNRLYKCPACGDTITVNAEVFYGKCPACAMTIIDYSPAPHQVEFHKSNATYKLNLGGYGSGKTTMCCAEVTRHSLTVPAGRTLICGPKLQQVNEAVIPELDKFLPPWLIKRRVLSPTMKITLVNDHDIIVYASNDEENIRSLNLTGFYIEEASGVDYSIFVQLQARLRNKNAIIKNPDGSYTNHSMGLICSNPEDNGWFMDKFILLSNKIYGSKSIDLSDFKKLKNRKEEKVYFNTFLSSTRDNEFLPEGFLEKLTLGKTPFWISKYIDCNLSLRDGVVYPEYTKCLVEPFHIPSDWMRIAGFDPGFRDQTAFPMAAIDPATGVIYVYEDYYVAEQPVSYHAEHIKELCKGVRFYNNIQADPSVRKRNERDGNSYKDYFYKLSGIYLEEGNNDIVYGIEKVRNYMFNGKLKFFTTCTNITFEALKYRYPEIRPNDNTTKYNIPLDRYNHLWDAIRYMIAVLPEDPRDMQNIYASDSGVLAVLDGRIPVYTSSDDNNYDDNIVTTKYFTSGRY